MRVSIIKQNSINNIDLPAKVEGNYWISDTDRNGISRNLISIEAENGQWKLCSNKEAFYVVNEIMQPSIYLENYKFYTIKDSVSQKNFLLYCSPTYIEYKYYSINEMLEKGITFGSDSSSIIQSKILEANAFQIKMENGKVILTDNRSKYGVYVNNVRILYQTELKTGDVIFTAGLKFVFLEFNVVNGKGYFLGVVDVGGITVQLMNSQLPMLTQDDFSESEDEIEFPLYDESDYFHKTPRFSNPLKVLTLNLDAPPQKGDRAESPLLLTIGPMITMSMTSLVTGYTALNNVLSGNATWSRAMPSLVMCVAMFGSVFIWPMISKKYAKEMSKKREQLRQRKYSEYIDSKRKMIVNAKKEQTLALNNLYPNLKDCQDMILSKYATLWQRRLEDEDFLSVNLGNGSYKMAIDIHYPEEHFSMDEDNLKDLATELVNEPKLLSDVPVVFSFKDNKISAIIGARNATGEYARRLLLQLLAYQSYDDLKIVILTDNESDYQWKFMKNVPHAFTNDKTLRFFASNSDEYKEVCYYLSNVYERRKEASKNGEVKVENFDSYYLIITDTYKKIKNFDVIENILDNKVNYGFSLLVLDERLANLPDQCKTFVDLGPEKGELCNNDDIENRMPFKVDFATPIDYERLSKCLSNIPISFKNNEQGQLPDKVGLLEMYDVGKVEQLNSNVRWRDSNPMLNLQAPVGIGKNGEKISIDLHEKYHGPHGLIAGMTGSGKSEFIITYILSMAINYHPYEVQFILIDYKGGGLAGAFENKSTGLKLPHLIGTITNLDANEINRSLASIESELKRRQGLFNKAREISNESTVDIYKYQKMYRNGIVDEPVSHLFIISDEFAELKNQQPEFMDQLISTARIGRSLGVHLILATQKPSGVVDPQIWSNTRFRVCMRVQDRADSNEVIKCDDAAYLKQTGRFYFQVGYNEVFILGQAAWAGGKYIPSDKVAKTLDTSLNVINNIGYSIKDVETRAKREKVVASNGEELSNIVKYLSDIALKDNIKCRPLWLNKIPEIIKVEDLAVKYNYNKEDFFINPIIGEYDVPNKQEQRLLTLPISKEGNALIYGASGSGKENFITTMIYSSMLYYNPKELNYYIIDFGSETLRMFKNSPIVGDILGTDDEDKLANLFKMIEATIESRKNLFANYNGDYAHYCKNSGKSVPSMVIVINNFEAYQETYSQFDDALVMLSRDCNRYGIYFVVALNTPNGMRFKLKQNFSLTYALQQNNDEDYTTILGNVHKKFPSKIFGRGIIRIDDIYEFQTALAYEDKGQIPSFIKDKCDEYSAKYNIRAKSVPVLPSEVTYKDIASEFGKDRKLIVGINKDDLQINKFDFGKNFATIVSSMDISSSSDFMNALINQIVVVNNKSLIVINAEDYYINDKYKDFYQYIEKDFDKVFTKINGFVDSQYEKYVKANYDREIFGDKCLYCIIIGVENFKNRLSDDNKLKFGEMFTKAKDLGVINYIFVDSADKFKKIEIDAWYKTCVNGANGIWIGNGINDQYSLKVSQKIEEMKKDIPESFCFVINRGKAKYVKYVSRLDLNLNSDEK